LKERVVILGAGGHAKVIVDVLEGIGELDIAGFTSPQGTQETLCGYPRLGTDDALDEILRSGVRLAFAAVGENERRKACIHLLRASGFGLINVISPHAVISARAVLGEGVAVLPGAIINAAAQISDGVIVNTNASVDHDCVIGACAHIAPGAVVAGCVRVGDWVLLGVGSRVIPGISIGEGTTIGAGAVVVRDVPKHVVAMGVPATVRRKHD
jgi:UDP-perosamine 4-acetyltransferase